MTPRNAAERHDLVYPAERIGGWLHAPGNCAICDDRREARAAALDEIEAALERLTTWPRVSWFAYDAEVKGVPVNPTEDRVVIDRAEALAAITAARR